MPPEFMEGVRGARARVISRISVHRPRRFAWQRLVLRAHSVPSHRAGTTCAAQVGPRHGLCKTVGNIGPSATHVHTSLPHYKRGGVCLSRKSWKATGRSPSANKAVQAHPPELHADGRSRERAKDKVHAPARCSR